MNKFLKNKPDIIAWLDSYNIKNYELIADEKYGYVVDIGGDVELAKKGLSFVPIKFNNVSGSFYCNNNNLTSLEFGPTIVGGNFSCSNNILTSLENCPTTVNGSFYCSYNKLTSLEFCTNTNIGDFDCSNNNLTSLEFCPKTIKGDFYCIGNNLTSLQFCPKTINGDFYFDNNKIADLIHFPNHIGDNIYLASNILIGIDMSKCYKFEEIYKIHSEHKITAEKELLNNILDANPKEISYCKINKLKI